MPVDSYTRAAEVIDIYDGDTVTVLADLGFSSWIKTKIRMLGIDTPEIRGSEKQWGLISKERLISLIMRNPQGRFGFRVWLKTKRPDKYGGRWLGYLYFWDDPDVSINQTMIDDRYARPYDGGKKTAYPLEQLPIQPEGVEAS